MSAVPERLKALNVARPGTLVRTLLHEVASAEATTRAAIGNAHPHPQGQDVLLRPIEPAEDDGDALLTALKATFEKYCVLPPHPSVALALAVMLAYTHDVQSISPLIVLRSPPRALINVNLTEGVLTRLVQKYEPTLLVDESDDVLAENAGCAPSSMPATLAAPPWWRRALATTTSRDCFRYGARAGSR